jgi:hypothetical protein
LKAPARRHLAGDLCIYCGAIYDVFGMAAHVVDCPMMGACRRIDPPPTAIGNAGEIGMTDAVPTSLPTERPGDMPPPSYFCIYCGAMFDDNGECAHGVSCPLDRPPQEPSAREAVAKVDDRARLRDRPRAEARSVEPSRGRAFGPLCEKWCAG